MATSGPEPSSAGAGPIALIAALAEELAPIKRRTELALGWTGVSDFIRATLGGADVLLVASGDGKENATRTAEELIARHAPALLIGAGVAGALSSGLERGTVVVSRIVRDGDGDEPLPDPEWLERAVRRGARAATLLTIDRPLFSSASKSERLVSLGNPDVAAVDMESSAWARAAASRGVPWIVVRCVYDEAREDLPAFLADCLDSRGHVSRACVALHAATHPLVLPELLRLRQRLKEVTEKLAAFVQTLLSNSDGAGQ